MKPTKTEQEKMGENAALLLIRSEQEDSTGTREQFDAFVRSSVHHVKEMLLLQAVSTELESIDHHRQIDIENLPVLPELETSLPGRDGNKFAHTGSRPARPRRWAISLAAAAAVLGLGMVLWIGLLSRTSHYSTGIGEQRLVKLPDGSMMILNTSSRAKVAFSEHVRQIRLLEGEALFTVERDSTRPFRVATDSSVVQAVGTQFNVYRRADGTRVSVIEGVVQVSSPQDTTDEAAVSSLPLTTRLKAGDEVEVTRDRVVKAKHPDVLRTVSWRSRKLAFKQTTLEDVAREFNRYNAVRLKIEGDELRRIMVSGLFDADDVQPIVDFVAETPGLRVKVVRDEREIVIRDR